MLDLSRAISIMFLVASLSGCGEPMFENAGSQHSLLEDREACAMEMDQSPPVSRSDSKAAEAFVRAVEDKLVRASGGVQTHS
ncbi:MAG: hypothetical protein D4R81_03985 [Nitrospiraceae bacterium]|nr:MAG: hypothetical protein D4R81_03985 [Nitrospiraceae bacterium]